MTKIWMMFPDEQKKVKLQEVTGIGLQVTTRRHSIDKNKKRRKRRSSPKKKIKNKSKLLKMLMLSLEELTKRR